jgi:hypothetical protein
MTTTAGGAPLRDLIEIHNECRVCGEPSETVRQDSNPVWGLDETGNPYSTVEEWLATNPPADTIEGVCFAHLRWARDGQGGFIEPFGSKVEQKSGNWMVQQQARRKQARTTLITLLGGDCEECGQVRPHEEMRIQVRGHSRERYDIGTRHEWYEFIANKPELLEATTLRCMACATAAPVASPRVSPRDRAIEAYGGRCWSPDCTRTDGLAIAARPGTAPLRWPNGDKYNPAAKLRWLANHNYPQGWVASCPAHLVALRQTGRRDNP